MMYLYMDFSGGTEMNFSHLICKGGQEYMEVYFERSGPTDSILSERLMHICISQAARSSVQPAFS